MYRQPKILFVDIETAYMLVRSWGIRKQYHNLNSIKEDWSIIAWAAKWRGQKKVYYADTGNQKNKRDDSKILGKLWELFNEADIVVGQSSDRFDIPRINARFKFNKIKKGQPPSPYKQQDTYKMSKKKFGLTSHKLEYMCKFFDIPIKKMVKRQFEGLELWIECIENNNKKAWAEMRKYNPTDLLATELVYEEILAWSNNINPNVYHKMHDNICMCGSKKIKKDGHDYQKTGKFQRYRCNDCGHPWIDKTNELSTKKRQKMLR